MNTELRLNHSIAGSNKHGKSAKDNSISDLVKITCQDLKSGSNVQSKITICYRNISWQSKAWHAATQIIQRKSLIDLKPKGIRKYNGIQVNIASYVNIFRLSRKLEHGKTDIKQACLRARCTHYRAFHDNLSIHPSIIHIIQARHGKNNIIACTDQLQHRQNCKQVDNLPDSQSSKSRARLTKARVPHNCKQRYGWIEHYSINKTSLLIILKRGTDQQETT